MLPFLYIRGKAKDCAQAFYLHLNSAKVLAAAIVNRCKGQSYKQPLPFGDGSVSRANNGQQQSLFAKTATIQRPCTRLTSQRLDCLPATVQHSDSNVVRQLLPTEALSAEYA